MRKPLGYNEKDAALNLIKAANLSVDTPKYALTISPPQKEGVNINVLYKRYLKIIYKLKSWYSLYPELDKNGRLHFHGIIYKNHINYNKDLELLKTKLGFICIKEIHSMDKWLKYCRKEFKTTKKILSIHKEISPIDIVGDNQSYDILSYFLMKDNQPFGL